MGLNLLDTNLKSRELSIELKMCYHIFVAFWKEPLQASREVLIDISQEAMMTGQIEFAMSSAFNSCRMSFFCSQDLVKGEINCTSLAKRMVSNECCCSCSYILSYSLFIPIDNIPTGPIKASPE